MGHLLTNAVRGENMTSNPVIDSLLAHRSIRRFKADPVGPDIVAAILQAGIRGATSYNLQNYAILLVDDPKKRDALGLAHAPLVVISLVDQYRLQRWFDAHEAGPSCFNQAHNLFTAFWDAIIVLQNIVVAAESLGLGTCYYGHILGVDVQALFGTPEYVFPAGMVAVGYPDERPPLNMRLPLEAVVHQNQYHVPSEADIRRWYSLYDAEWDTLSLEEKTRLEAQGIHKIAQKVAGEACSAQAIGEKSRDILQNLRRARFLLEGEERRDGNHRDGAQHGTGV
jgi:FMN reductase (NADPH)